MTNIDTRPLKDCIGREVLDRSGDKVGKVADVYVDEDTRQPEWLAVTSGMFGRKLSFVPIEAASFQDDDVWVDFDKDHIKDAPAVDADGHLSPEEERELYAHYDWGHSQRRSDTVLPDDSGTRRESNVGGTEGAMTRSEEELDVDKVERPAGRARLKKWVETEHKQFTVPVRREKAKLVTEPITEANRDRAMRGADIRENEHEVTLYEEDVEVDTKTVPKERVRLETETVTEDRTVEADVAKERIDVEGDVSGRQKK